ncbi:MAG TPA: serine/threonine-protein kinase [Myxococcaceae bacterium]|nr:serine/threonine-protein kinase [Myxococcaceae bacterium]
MFADFDPLDLKPGQMVSHWRVVRRIGKGGYAVVYEVEKDGQRFALKLACQTERSLDPKQTDARARREAACLQQLNHPHIIRMWAQGRWPDARSGLLYIVLDFVDGYTLARWVERTNPTPHEVIVLFLKLFDALDHIHRHDMCHRDLSLRNIMVTKEGEPVIIDFGSADYVTAEDLTDGPLPPGTPRNRSPEAQKFWDENRLKPGARYAFKPTDDIFALGANLYDVLTDPTPTRGDTRPLLGNPLIEPPTPHRKTKGRVPMELSAYAMKLISRDLEERPATAKDARRPLVDLERFEGEDWRQLSIRPASTQLSLPEKGAPADAAPAPSAVGAASRHSSRRAWLRPVFVRSLALSVLVAVVAASLPHRPAQPGPSVARSAHEARPPASSPLAEKPTSRPTRLASPLPTQQEANPSVKLPDNSPTLTTGVPHPQQVQKGSSRRVLSKVKLCAGLVASVAWLEAGCTGVQTRPDPEPCPEEALKAMRQELDWGVNAYGPSIVMDVTKGWTLEDALEEPTATYKDGPVTGAVIPPPEGKEPVGTRVDGHLWTTGDRIYGRYIRAHLPGGRIVPICIELENSDGLGSPKMEGSKPGAAVAAKVSSTRVAKRWR